MATASRCVSYAEAIFPLVSALMLCVLFSLSGCGSGDERPFRDDSRDPAAYAARIKNFVLNELEYARESSEPEGLGFLMVNELEQYPENPVGEHEETYAKLLELAKQLREHLQSGGGLEDEAAEAITAEMTALAKELPGERQMAEE